MIVGLPGAGKTTWGLTRQKEMFDKRYNIIGTDTLIDKMKVNGLPRKNNYHGRWETLISKATNCLNKLFQIGQIVTHFSIFLVKELLQLSLKVFFSESSISRNL